MTTRFTITHILTLCLLFSIGSLKVNAQDSANFASFANIPMYLDAGVTKDLQQPLHFFEIETRIKLDKKQAKGVETIAGIWAQEPAQDVFTLYLVPPGKVKLAVGNGEDSQNPQCSSPALPREEWVNVRATWNAEGQIEVFYNDERVAQCQQDGKAGWNTLSPLHLRIGAEHSAQAERHFNGNMDWLKITAQTRNEEKEFLYEYDLGAEPIRKGVILPNLADQTNPAIFKTRPRVWWQMRGDKVKDQYGNVLPKEKLHANNAVWWVEKSTKRKEREQAIERMEESKGQEIQIYPNPKPSQASLIVELQDTNTREPKSYVVYNLKGQTIIEGVLNAEKAHYLIEDDLPKGQFLIYFKGKEERVLYTGKFIVE